ncbi:hypothetical protein [Acidicapsa ligni]|uniref:hypothetical protein n=1 Tax=Acidicapsa ligni TaxID=542300 RepID=UPI0021DFC7F6|nr:hypothetical protein [Acidicapsa ligni]
MSAAKQIRSTGQDTSHVVDTSPSADLLNALHGLDANRERTVANRTRRVVRSSLGVRREQQQGGSRNRAVALGFALLVLVLIAPLIWEVTDSLIAGEHLADPGSQLSLWACIVCPTILGAVLVAGWWKKRS